LIVIDVIAERRRRVARFPAWWKAGASTLPATDPPRFALAPRQLSLI